MNTSLKTMILLGALAVAVTACKQQGAPTPVAADGAATAGGTQPEVAPPKPVSALQIKNWAPQTTAPGVAFNAQPDGNSGIFFEFDGELPKVPFTATFAGKPLSGVVASGNVVTATIPPDYIAVPGSYDIEIQVPSENATIGSVTFSVK